MFEILLFAIFEISGQIKENSLIWKFLILSIHYIETMKFSVRQLENQRIAENRVLLCQMSLLFLSNIFYFISTTYKYVRDQDNAPHAWIANWLVFFFTSVPFGHIMKKHVQPKTAKTELEAQ